MNAKFSVSLFWDARVMDAKTKESRVMLTINLKGEKQFRISLKERCTKKDFESAINTRSKQTKELRNALNDYVEKAEVIIEKMSTPSKELFLKHFKSEFDYVTSDKTSVHVTFRMRYEELQFEKRYGTAHRLKAVYNSLLRYKAFLSRIVIDKDEPVETLIDKVELSFEEIDAQFLKSYKAYMIDKGRTETTCGIYLGHLRSFYNYSVERGIIPAKDKKLHPFAKLKISNKVKSKSVLYPAEIKKLWSYKTNGVREERAKAIWFALYFMNGMNWKDLIHLRWKNIKADTLTFVRLKTKDTALSTKEISMHLNDEVKQIIAVHGNKDKAPEAFIFPFLSNCKDSKHMETTQFRNRRVLNKKLAEIGRNLGFDVHLCLNLARHSFATTLKLNGTPVAAISDCMGHTTVNTTMHYMKSLPTEHLKQISNSLLSFNDDNKPAMLVAV